MLLLYNLTRLLACARMTYSEDAVRKIKWYPPNVHVHERYMPILLCDCARISATRSSRSSTLSLPSVSRTAGALLLVEHMVVQNSVPRACAFVSL